jgi:Rieske Fe-S protein
VDRRKFLKVAPACLLLGCATVPMHRAEVRDGKLLVDEAELELFWLKSSAVIVHNGTVSAVLLRQAGGGYRALEADCPHLGCQVRPGKKVITCPCHGSAFALDGQVLRGPAERSLLTYPIERRDGILEITIYSE